MISSWSGFDVCIRFLNKNYLSNQQLKLENVSVCEHIDIDRKQYCIFIDAHSHMDQG